MKERSKAFENRLDGQSKSAEGAFDDAEYFARHLDSIRASDIAFQAALDHAITMKLETCSTSPSTELGTRSPVFIPHDYY
jgi:hypothetical protein